MIDLKAPFENLKMPSRELPEIGQRVRVICVKEMIYMGNADDSGGDWKYDGFGLHTVMFWEEIQQEVK